VVDFARFQGFAATPIDKESRIIAFAPSLSFNSSLLVGRVMGLRNVAEMKPQANADTATASWSSQRYVDNESQVWTELDLSLVVQDPQFLQVGS
jgi:twitching motility protein PilI